MVWRGYDAGCQLLPNQRGNLQMKLKVNMNREVSKPQKMLESMQGVDEITAGEVRDRFSSEFSKLLVARLFKWRHGIIDPCHVAAEGISWP